MNEQKRRFQFRFTIRVLLVLTFILALGTAWFTNRLAVTKKQRSAVAHLMAVGGQASYGVDETTWVSGAWGRESNGKQNILARWLGDGFFRNVTRVTFSDSRIIDGEFRRFKEPEKIVVDDDLRHLAELPNLKSLSLYQTNITDAGLLHLYSLHNLEFLILEGTKVTDDEVEKLQDHLPNCKIIR